MTNDRCHWIYKIDWLHTCPFMPNIGHKRYFVNIKTLAIFSFLQIYIEKHILLKFDTIGIMIDITNKSTLLLEALLMLFVILGTFSFEIFRRVPLQGAVKSIKPTILTSSKPTFVLPAEMVLTFSLQITIKPQEVVLLDSGNF